MRGMIDRLTTKIRERGYTLVPVELYFRKGIAKVLLGVAKGRKQYRTARNGAVQCLN